MTLFSFKFFGIPVIVDWSVIPLLVLLGFDSVIYLRKHFKYAEYHPKFKLTIVLLAVAMFLSIAAHEAGHGVIAYLFGHPLREAKFSFLIAYVAPTEGVDEIPALDFIFITLAGPIVNLVLGLIASIWVKKLPETFVENSIQYFAYLNIYLGKLNLFPVILFGVALDGGWVALNILRVLGLSLETAYVVTTFLGTVFLGWYIFRVKIHGKRILKYTNWEDRLETL